MAAIFDMLGTNELLLHEKAFYMGVYQIYLNWIRVLIVYSKLVVTFRRLEEYKKIRYVQ